MSKCIRCGKPIRNNRSVCSYCDGYLVGLDKGKMQTIDEVIKNLAKSEDTILSDKQYYEVLKLKGGAENAEE